MKKISIIILCHNNPYIDCVVSSVKKQINPADEIFVVNDHSSSRICELLQGVGDDIKIITPSLKGNRAYNRNYAAKQSTGEILVFIDGDVLLEEGAIQYIRSYQYNGISGLCGSVAAMQVVPEEANIILKKFYASTDWHATLDFDYYHHMFPDNREGIGHLPWNRFYSAICVIPRNIFFLAGSFDEQLSEWGGEDIDLGYRLSSFGSLVFDKNVRGIHIPHPRNQFKNEMTSRQNMYAMLAKYRNRDMEELLSFACAQRTHEALNAVLLEMRKYPNPFCLRATQEHELCLSPVSTLNPDGNITYFSDGRFVEESFLGLALPFDDFYFSQSRTDTRIFSYPIGLATRIMQELLRVSSMLIVEKSDFPLSIIWGDTEEKFKHVFCYYKLKQFCDSYSDFDIKDDGDRFVVILVQKS